MRRDRNIYLKTFIMTRTRTSCLISVVLSLTLLLGACGGNGDEGKAAGGSSALTGNWYSSSIRTSWTFNSDSTGTIRTQSFDGTSCQITDIRFSVNATSNAITYYGTRYQQKSSPSRSDDYDLAVTRGPYTATYTLTSGTLAIGNGRYSRSSIIPCQ